MEDSSNVNVNANAKSPDSETPPQPKPTFPNSISSAKRHRTLLHAPPPTLYRECLKNHAAPIGGLALDGCGEFMPSPAAALTCASPAALTCAACGCHRNFHRREPDDPSAHFIGFRRHQALPPPPPLSRSLTPSRSPSPPHMLLALSSGGDQKQKPPNRENPNGGKRFRTRFSETQKVKMQAFAEKLGWKMNRSEERAVEEFCNEVGVNRGVLKVWIHNNKQKRDHHHQHQINNNNMNHENVDNRVEENGRVSFDACNNNNNNTDSENHQNECNSIAHLHVSTNGSSSSS